MFEKLERRFGKYTIPHLMRYIVFGNALIYLVYMFVPGIIGLLNMNPYYILKGQVWRLVTFIFVPSTGSSIFMLALSLFCYYWIGESLERSIGSFRFGCYYLIGWAAIVVVNFLLYFAGNSSLAYMGNQMSVFNQTLFIALATLHPDIQILLFYFIPLKAKWAGIFSALIIVYEFFASSLAGKMLILASILSYLVFFLPQFIQRMKNRKRRQEFEKAAGGGYAGFGGAYYKGTSGSGSTQSTPRSGFSTRMDNGRNVKKVAFHRCSVCGITEVDDPQMSFRYCSSCNGNYEYCEQHIHNHTHVN